jgi:hypothetical protein
VPFTGAIKTASSVVTGGLNFVLGEVNPPAEPNLFLDWSDISTSVAKLVQDYQSAVSVSAQNTLNAQVNSSAGINSILAGGNFLGVSQKLYPGEYPVRNYKFNKCACDQSYAPSIKDVRFPEY